MTDPFAADFRAAPYWWDAAEPPVRDGTLPDEADIAIVGGGYAGLSAALTLAGGANEPFALDGLRFPALPLYEGRPWFLPLVGEWFRFRDRIDRAAA